MLDEIYQNAFKSTWYLLEEISLNEKEKKKHIPKIRQILKHFARGNSPSINFFISEE